MNERDFLDEKIKELIEGADVSHIRNEEHLYDEIHKAMKQVINGCEELSKYIDEVTKNE